MPAYIKTEWVDGENKYSITDQNGKVIPGFENIKLMYTGTGGTPLSSEKMNHIEEGLSGVISESFITNAEQNIQLWELEAQVIQDKEDMVGWQGEGFFPYGDTIASMSNVAITKGVGRSDGYARFGKLNVDTTAALGAGALAPSVSLSVSDIVYTPDGVYMVALLQTTPFIKIFKCFRDQWTPLPNPSTLPTGQANAANFSGDGVYLVVSHNGSPYVTIYKRSGDTFNKLPDITSGPTYFSYANGLSSDGVYLTIGWASNSPYLGFYKRSGDTFTKLANPASMPGGNVGSICTSSDGVYVFVLQNTGAFLVYKRSGDVYTQIASLGTMPTANSMAITSDGIYIAIGGASINSTSPFLRIFKRTSDTISELTLGAQPTNQLYGVSFSADNTYLYASAAGVCNIYKRSGDTFTALSVAVNQSKCGAFSPDGLYLVSGNYNSGISVAVASNLLLTPTTGNIILNTLTLPQVSNSVFILDDKVLTSGVTTSYDVSLDGGVTWQLGVQTGSLVTLNHSGTQLIVRLNFARAVSGVGTGKVNWLAAWAGVA